MPQKINGLNDLGKFTFSGNAQLKRFMSSDGKEEGSEARCFQLLEIYVPAETGVKLKFNTQIL